LNDLSLVRKCFRETRLEHDPFQLNRIML
jgi:hypothetical protein